MNSLPKDLRDVLAQIESENDLGKTSWYEVVYHNGEEWCSYADSSTFSTLGDNVIDWVYCDEVLAQKEMRPCEFFKTITVPKEFDLPDGIHEHADGELYVHQTYYDPRNPKSKVLKTIGKM